MNTTEIMEVAHSIQLAVAPVFLLSAVGVTLTVLTNRLSRIIDRARLLEGLLVTKPEAKIPTTNELAELSQRARLIHWAITLSTACALLISLVIVSLFLGFALGRDLSWLIVILFIAALAAFVGALLTFLFEIRSATATLRFGPGPH
jgi:hypothetical protein